MVKISALINVQRIVLFISIPRIIGYKQICNIAGANMFRFFIV
jgi:hypothetical protein